MGTDIIADSRRLTRNPEVESRQPGGPEVRLGEARLRSQARIPRSPFLPIRAGPRHHSVYNPGARPSVLASRLLEGGGGDVAQRCVHRANKSGGRSGD